MEWLEGRGCHVKVLLLNPVLELLQFGQVGENECLQIPQLIHFVLDDIDHNVMESDCCFETLNIGGLHIRLQSRAGVCWAYV